MPRAWRRTRIQFKLKTGSAGEVLTFRKGRRIKERGKGQTQAVPLLKLDHSFCSPEPSALFARNHISNRNCENLSNLIREAGHKEIMKIFCFFNVLAHKKTKGRFLEFCKIRSKPMAEKLDVKLPKLNCQYCSVLTPAQNGLYHSCLSLYIVLLLRTALDRLTQKHTHKLSSRATSSPKLSVCCQSTPLLTPKTALQGQLLGAPGGVPTPGSPSLHFISWRSQWWSSSTPRLLSIVEISCENLRAETFLCWSVILKT